MVKKATIEHCPPIYRFASSSSDNENDAPPLSPSQSVLSMSSKSSPQDCLLPPSGQRVLKELFHPLKARLSSQTDVKLIEEKEKVTREKQQRKKGCARKGEERKKRIQTESELIILLVLKPVYFFKNIIVYYF